MENAFKYWQQVTPLTFKYTDGTPDIEVKFARGEHGDGQYNAFDGRGKHLKMKPSFSFKTEPTELDSTYPKNVTQGIQKYLC